MSNRDWLSLAEIARLWSAECGESAEELERDLATWFSEFVARAPTRRLVSSNRDGDTTNRLMGMLGGRHLERQTLEAYCEERGRPKPRFWFSGPVEAPQREAPQGAAPCRAELAAREPEAGAPRSGAEPPSAGPARDPELESFQTQIADMSERLKAPGVEYASLEQASAPRQAATAPQSGPAAAPMGQNERALIERAEAASAKARQLKMQLEAAEQRITDLTGSAASHPAGSTAESEGSDPASTPSPAEPRRQPKASVPSERPVAAGYRDSSATVKLLLQGTRRKGRGRTMLVTGLAVPMAALVLWGGLQVIQLASNEPIPPPTFGSPAGQAPAVVVSETDGPGAEQRDIGGDDPGRPGEPWSAGETKPTVAELTAARHRLEAAMESAAAEAGPSRKELILAIEIARAQAALYQQDLDAARERLARSEAEAQTANARADLLTKELIDTRQRHLAAAEIAVADDNNARRQLARDALAASKRADSLERDLDAARRRISGLQAQLGAARSETATLTQQLAQLRKEHAALLEIFRAQTRQGSR